MEVYIPWNDTWIYLPELPDLGDGVGRMDQTYIMELSGSGGSHLYLLGGSHTDWKIGFIETTKTVWRLVWDMGSKTYSWTDMAIPELGR